MFRNGSSSALFFAETEQTRLLTQKRSPGSSKTQKSEQTRGWPPRVVKGQGTPFGGGAFPNNQGSVPKQPGERSQTTPAPRRSSLATPAAGTHATPERAENARGRHRRAERAKPAGGRRARLCKQPRWRTTGEPEPPPPQRRRYANVKNCTSVFVTNMPQRTDNIRKLTTRANFMAEHKGGAIA